MYFLTDEEIYKNIVEMNPFWKNGKLDKTLVCEYKRIEFNDVCKVFFHEIRRFPILSGPRRVGKTTIVFQIIDKLLKDGIDPKRILYYTLDEYPNDEVSIKEVIRVYKEKVYDNDDYYLFIDEASKDKGWKNYLKRLFDLSKNVRAIITGSSSVELVKESDDSGAGRFITIKIPTLSFYDFCMISGYKVNIDDVNVFNFHTLSAIEQEITLAKLQTLTPYFNKYLTIGGFPEFVKSNDYVYINKLIREQIVSKVIYQDIPRAYDIKNVSSLSSLFTYFCYNTSNVINVETISKELGIDRTTINSYIDCLAGSNLIYIAEQLNLSGKNPLKARRKIHVLDIGIVNAVTRNKNVLDDSTNLGLVIETVVFKHVKDYFDSLDDDIYTVGYSKDEKGREIDIVVKQNSIDYQYIEAKNRNHSIIKDDDGIVIYGLKDKPGYVITKKENDYGLSVRKNTTLYRMPAPAFLYIIGKSKESINN